MAKIYVANRVQPDGKRKIEIPGLEITAVIGQLKQKISTAISVPSSDFELVYSGQKLKNDQTLSSYGIKDGVTVYAIKMPPTTKMEHAADSSFDTITIQQLLLALRTAVVNPAFQSTVSHIGRTDMLNNLLAVIPSLRHDRVAINFLQDPDLLHQLTDETCLTRVLEAHPCLAEAIGHVAAAVHEETSASTSAYSYSLNGLSDDDEDMDPLNTGHSSQRDHSTAAITSAQLASALAAVNTSNPSSSNVNNVSSMLESPNSSLSNQQQVITRDMLSNAMQQALNAASPSQSAQDTQSQQLEQLRAMGITDDAVSLQALQATGGDVQAALELIFGDLPSSSRSSHP